MLDVVAIIAAVAAIAWIGLLFAAKSQHNTGRINCVNNLRQVGLAFKLWSPDSRNIFPTQVSTNDGGTRELIESGLAYPHFQVMSNELSTPKVLFCPDDSQKTRATYFDSALNDSNISYFVAPEADEAVPEMWLVGDRNLTANSTELNPGLFTLKTNQIMGWSARIHKRQGNLGFADGSVQQVTSPNLQRFATNALRANFTATTNTSFRIAIP